MSATRWKSELLDAVENRWQMPLLIVSAILLIGGLLQLRPERPVPSYAKQKEQLISLKRAGLYPEAVQFAEAVLKREERTTHERSEIHALVAETRYAMEATEHRHVRENLVQMLQSYDRAEKLGWILDGEAHRRIGDAWRWLNRETEAVEAYREALRQGVEDELTLLQSLAKLALKDPQQDRVLLHDQLSDMIDRGKDRPEILTWAIDEKIHLLIDERKAAEAKALLENHEADVAKTAWGDEYVYLAALVHYALEEYDQAELILRALRDRLKFQDMLDAKSGWLLGRIHLHDGRPQLAMSFFQNVITSHLKGDYVVASRLGLAESLALLQRHEPAEAEFSSVLESLAKQGDNPAVDLADVRAAMTAEHQLLLDQGDKSGALRFLTMALGTVPDDAKALRVNYLQLSAALNGDLARDKHEAGQAVTEEKDSGLRRTLLAESRDHFIVAAEAQLEVARLSTLDEMESASAMWEAANYLDSAGTRSRTIEVLSRFVKEHPSDTRISEALFRLGQAYQADLQFEKAIEAYQENQKRFPRTLAGVRSLVPLAQSYSELGDSGFELAEKTLVMMVEDSDVLSPESPEFERALFALAKLYDRQNKHEDTVIRLEEALQRYPEEQEMFPWRFMLAQAYRASGMNRVLEIADEKNVMHKDYLEKAFRERLVRSVELFDRVARDLSNKQGNPSELESLFAEQSLLYRSDGYFELGRYEEALSSYRDVVGRYPTSSAYLAAYVQMIRIYLRQGRIEEARSALSNAKTRLTAIPDEAFSVRAIGQSRETWETYLDQLSKVSAFRPTSLTQPDPVEAPRG
jgi:tetratricopeptide (TPR) repeat protein